VVFGIADSARRPRASWVAVGWLFVCAGLFAGLLLMRLAQAEGDADVALAWGMAVVELVILAALKLTAHHVAHARDAWVVEYDVYRSHENV